HRTERVDVDGPARNPRLNTCLRVGGPGLVEVGRPSPRRDDVTPEREQRSRVRVEPGDVRLALGPGELVAHTAVWPGVDRRRRHADTTGRRDVSWLTLRRTRGSASADLSSAWGAVTWKVTLSPARRSTSMSSTTASGCTLSASSDRPRTRVLVVTRTRAPSSVEVTSTCSAGLRRALSRGSE